MSWSAPAFAKDPVFREYSQSSKAVVDGICWLKCLWDSQPWQMAELVEELGWKDPATWLRPEGREFFFVFGNKNKQVNISEPWNRGSSCPKRSSLDVSRIVELCPKHFLKKEEMVTMGGFPFGMIRSLTLENQFTKNGFFGTKNCCRFHDSTTRGASTIDVHLQAAPGWRWSYFTSGAHIPWRFCRQPQGGMPTGDAVYVCICHSKLFKASCSFLTLSES